MVNRRITRAGADGMKTEQRGRGNNGGIRKRCGCPSGKWGKCAHPWHMNFRWQGVHYRLSLDKEIGKRLENKSDAKKAAERLRTEIREGRFRPEQSQASIRPAMTFSQFADAWKEKRGVQL